MRSHEVRTRLKHEFFAHCGNRSRILWWSQTVGARAWLRKSFAGVLRSQEDVGQHNCGCMSHDCTNLLKLEAFRPFSHPLQIEVEPGNEPALKFYQRLGFEASPNTKSFLHSPNSRKHFRNFRRLAMKRSTKRDAQSDWPSSFDLMRGQKAVVLSHSSLCICLFVSNSWLVESRLSEWRFSWYCIKLRFAEGSYRSEKLEEISSLIQPGLIQVLDLTRIWLDWYDPSLTTKKVPWRTVIHQIVTDWLFLFLQV